MAAISHKVVDRGIPFVIEKPAGVDVPQLQAIADAAHRAKVPATVPFVQRNAPVETWLRQAGDIVYERLSFVAGPPGRYRRNGSPWMLDPPRSGGGCLTNLGPHFVDLALRHIGASVDVTHKRSVVGDGSVPWGQILRHLRNVKYDDALSLEYEYRWHPQDLDEPEVGFRRSAQHLRSLLAECDADTSGRTVGVAL
ncbi:hypothetical protein R1X32_02200 (plasmid) [Rhodococcus opacus]|jgi:predicted dehydrogenase|nr:hypothetical protein [Rhodococcus opacus]MCZ4590091.1 hypothetical protein [Rhodococcus opacus]WKN61166.1 hypothetical protein HJ581_0047050 [Rhodococcus opacus]